MDWLDTAAALLVFALVAVLPWVAMASGGRFDEAAWRATGRDKRHWFVLLWSVPLAGVAYFALVRPTPRTAAERAARS